MSNTRQLANLMCDEANRTEGRVARLLHSGGTAIDVLLDVIEAQRGPAVVPPAPEYEPLRTLRARHAAEAIAFRKQNRDAMADVHAEFVRTLNKYFPANDQL